MIQVRFKRGDVREDGKVFSRYDRSRGSAYARWATPEQLQKENEIKSRTTRIWRAKNRATVIAGLKAWRKANPHKVRCYKNERRAHCESATANTRLMQQIYLTAQRLTKCTGIRFEVDHIHPISRGGAHHESNLQILPKRINQMKYTKVSAGKPFS